MSFLLVGAFINKRSRLLQSLVFFFKERLETTNVKINVQPTKLLDWQTGSAFRIVQRVPPFSYAIFIERYKTGRDYRVPPLSFFSALCDFYSNFFLSPKGPPFKFFDILQRNVLIIPEGSPLLQFLELCDFFLKEKKCFAFFELLIWLRL